MSLCSNPPTERRRARPLLGTLVEIVVPDDPRAEPALEQAFAAVSQVQALLSAHDPRSDLGRLYAATAGTALCVHPWTWRVLAAAKKMHLRTSGAFDPAAGGTAALERGDLPAWSPGRPDPRAKFADLKLLPHRHLLCLRRVRIDLGGIAKGFAVDQAVGLLRRAGLPWGLVNAGGDLRAFGARSWTIHRRHPAAPRRFVSDTICNSALATSAPYFSERTVDGRTTSGLIDPVTGVHLTGAVSLSVYARTCLVADALTKVVLTPAGQRALTSYRAHACVSQTPETPDHHAA